MNVIDIATGKPLIESEPEDFGSVVEEFDADARRLGIQGMQREWNMSLELATQLFRDAGGKHLRSVAS